MVWFIYVIKILINLDLKEKSLSLEGGLMILRDWGGWIVVLLKLRGPISTPCGLKQSKYYTLGMTHSVFAITVR